MDLDTVKMSLIRFNSITTVPMLKITLNFNSFAQVNISLESKNEATFSFLPDFQKHLYNNRRQLAQKGGKFDLTLINLERKRQKAKLFKSLMNLQPSNGAH